MEGLTKEKKGNVSQENLWLEEIVYHRRLFISKRKRKGEGREGLLGKDKKGNNEYLYAILDDL